jgi:hypothetical protein
MVNKSRFPKFRKFITDPDLFFFDMFRKRVANKIAPRKTSAIAVPSDTHGPSQESQGLLDPAKINMGSIVEYLTNTIGAYPGVEDGADHRDLAVDTQTLPLLIQILKVLMEQEAVRVTFFTINGDYCKTFLPNSALSEGRVIADLNRKRDFCVEISDLQFSSLTFRFFLYDTNDQGIANLRTDTAWIRRFPKSQISEVYPQGLVVRYQPSPIDVVYTWVNHSDAGWQQLWKDSFPDQAMDLDRYTSHDEIKYSLRSINKYAPWVNRIFIVSNCEQPDWLSSNDKLTWINHESIFPSTNALPTFNSHAIEACLHRIPGLAEHFLYFNDDFLLGQNVKPRDFFDELGRSISYFEPYGMIHGLESAIEQPDYVKASNNSRRILLHTLAGYRARHLHRHVPYALLKSLLHEIEIVYPGEFENTRKAKIRSNTDINVPSFLYHHFAYVKGMAVKSDASSIIIRPSNIKKIVSSAFKFKFLCFNDGNGSATDYDYKRLSAEYFAYRYPEKAPWEI